MYKRIPNFSYQGIMAYITDNLKPKTIEEAVLESIDNSTMSEHLKRWYHTKLGQEYLRKGGQA